MSDTHTFTAQNFLDLASQHGIVFKSYVGIGNKKNTLTDGSILIEKMHALCSAAFTAGMNASATICKDYADQCLENDNEEAEDVSLYLAQAIAEQAKNVCWCLTCRPLSILDPGSMRMAFCPECGNKRCPRATSCLNDCTDSNKPGQPGSIY